MFSTGRFLQRFLGTLERKERVIEIADAGRTVTTEIDGQRCTYRECEPVYSVGQELEAPPKHRVRQYRMTWSPWDEPVDD